MRQPMPRATDDTVAQRRGLQTSNSPAFRHEIPNVISPGGTFQSPQGDSLAYTDMVPMVPLLVGLPQASASRRCHEHPRTIAIAETARNLVAQCDRRLNPPVWVK